LTPYVTRVTFSGSSNPYYNVNAYVTACPTATTCTIGLQLPSTAAPASSGSAATVTFSNGNVISPACLGWSSGSQTLGLQAGSSCSNLNTAQALNIGNTFTVSGATGANAAYWNGNTFFLTGLPIPYSGANPVGVIFEVPPNTQTSSGMTGVVIANDNYVRGQSQGVLGEIVNGPRVPFASELAQILLGASAIRLYQLGVDYSAQSAQGQSTQRGFGQILCNSAATLNCIQAGATPFYDQGADLVRTFNSPTNINLLAQRLASAGYLYGARGNAPDIGFNIESSLRLGSNGNLLLTGNFQDGAQSHSVDLTACDVSGQKKIRYVLDWKTVTITELASGTLTDTPTWPAGGAVIYLCPNNEAAEYSPPVIGARLADIPTAAKIIVQYAYAPYLLNQGTGNVMDCGAGVCTLPTDRKIGPLYFRILYLDTSARVLATSDVQVL
jgi:hypothetical protein